MAQPTHTTMGGYKTAAIYSGQVAPALTGVTGGVANGSDVLIWSGQGRLDSVVLHQFFNSGTVLTFYDGIPAISGGPLAASGHIPLFAFPGNGIVQSGTMGVGWGAIPVGTPFFKGLCVNSRSGQPGFTVTFTSEATVLPN